MWTCSSSKTLSDVIDPNPLPGIKALGSYTPSKHWSKRKKYEEIFLKLWIKDQG